MLNRSSEEPSGGTRFSASLSAASLQTHKAACARARSHACMAGRQVQHDILMSIPCILSIVFDVLLQNSPDIIVLAKHYGGTCFISLHNRLSHRVL